MKTTILGTALLCLCVAFTACGGDDDDGDGSGGTSGAGGSTGKGGSSGKGGSAGKGSSGSAGKGSGGSAGKSGGSGGSAGAEETAGAAGEDGGGGVANVGGQGGADNAGGADGEAGEGGQPGATIELRGRWTSEFGEEIIDNDVWDGSELIEFSNDENIAITRNPADAENGPSKYNRIVWTELSMASFYYCTTDFNLDTLAEARAADGTADDSNPEEGGCGGTFPWTKLTSNDIDIYGTWTNQFGGTEKIDALTWTTTFGEVVTVAKVIEFSNEDKQVITQNPPGAASGPSKFNRIVWTSLDGFLYYCTTDFNLDTLEDARDADTEADATDPATSGCGGANPWTQLTYTP